MQPLPKHNILSSDQDITENIESLDEKIYEKLKSINVAVLPNLRPDFEALKEQKRQFFNGDIDCPLFTYRRLEKIDFDKKEVDLQKLKDELLTDLYPEPIVRAYIWIINEKIAKVRLLKESKAMLNKNNAEQHAQRFTKYSEYIYGTPKKLIFNTTLAYIQHKIAALPKDSALQNTAAFALLNEVLRRADQDLPLLRHLEAKSHGEPLTKIEDIAACFTKGLEKFDLLKHGWTVVIDATGERDKIAVSQMKKQILLPCESELVDNRAKDRVLTPERINGLIEHEIGTHALRAENGSESELKLLQTGLDRYDVGEEGLATFREQQESGADDYAGFHGYFAAGLVKGLDNHGERNFAEVFAIIQAYFEICEGEESDKAKELAWTRCLRVFRGTTGQVPGAIFTKDILYREGNIKVHELYNQGLLDDGEANIGKYDLTSKRHRKVLREIGVHLKEI